jgi:hypothetical protein
MYSIHRVSSPASDATFDRQVDALVRDVSEKCIAPTCLRFGDAVAKMNAAELRGYARARAARPVGLLVRQLVADGRLGADSANRTAARAVERTAHLIVREMSMRVVAAFPMHASVRAAA